jgi:hypothetical protein
MDTVTYPHPEVRKFLAEHLVAVMLDISTQARDAATLTRPGVVLWTPLLIFCDPRGRVLRQSRGYLDPVHFVAEGRLALAMVALFNRRLDAATSSLRDLIESESTPRELRAEALYWSGVAAYRIARDKAVMVPIYEELVRRHPDSPWALKAWPYVGWEHGRAKLISE